MRGSRRCLPTPILCNGALALPPLPLLTTTRARSNFQISAGYYKLSLAFAELLGTTETSGAAFAINWPTMAAWASNSVGVSIRKEVPTGWMRSVLSFLPQAVVDFLLKFPQAVAPLFNGLLERTSKALALGNNAGDVEGRGTGERNLIAWSKCGWTWGLFTRALDWRTAT